MKVNSDIQGFDELQRRLKRAPDKVKRRELLKIIRVQTRPTIQAARQRAPISSEPHSRYSGGVEVRTYDPGNLRRSIGNITSKNRKYPNILVGPKAGAKKKYDGFYGHFVEFGTVNMPAQPFMRPAYESTGQGVGDGTADKVARKIEKILQKL